MARLTDKLPAGGYGLPNGPDLDDAMAAAMDRRNGDSGPDDMAREAGVAQANLDAALSAAPQAQVPAALADMAAAAYEGLDGAQEMADPLSSRAASLDHAEESLQDLRLAASTVAALDVATSNGVSFDRLIGSALDSAAMARSYAPADASSGAGAPASPPGQQSAASGSDAASWSDAAAAAGTPPVQDDRANEAGAAQAALNSGMQSLPQDQWTAQMRSLYETASQYLVVAQDMGSSVSARGQSLDQGMAALTLLQDAGAATPSVVGSTMFQTFSRYLDRARQAVARAHEYG